MSEDIKNPETKEAPKAVRSNPGKKAATEADSQAKGPKITKFPDGTIKEDF
jgi:hypothetical protein